MAEINLGTVTCVEKGIHNISATYNRLNRVKTTDEIVYEAKKDVPANIPLTNTEYWMRITGAAVLDITVFAEKTNLLDNDTSILVDSADSNKAKKWKFISLWNYINSKLSGAISTVKTTNLTASMVVVSDASGKLSSSLVSTSTLGYLSGLSGNVQTALAGKVDVFRRNIYLNDDFRNIISVTGNIGNSYRLVLHGTRGNFVFCGVFDITATHNYTLDAVMTSSSSYGAITLAAFSDSWGNHTIKARIHGGTSGENAPFAITVIPYYVSSVSLENFINYNTQVSNKYFL
jgi:hypothetical protein